MRVTILNGNPSVRNDHFEAYLRRLDDALREKGHQVHLLQLRELDIKHCVGCWGCWVKTPGECMARDDSAAVCRAVINADVLVFASPIIMGHTSALLKKAHDKFVSLVLPYLKFYDGEMHHPLRYPRAPRVGLLLAPEQDTDAEDLDIIKRIYRRNTLNFHTPLSFIKTTEAPATEVAAAIELAAKAEEAGSKESAVRIVGSLPMAASGKPGRNLAVFNGSPRGDRSGTAVLLSGLTAGFSSVEGRTFAQANLIRLGDQEKFRRMFEAADTVVLAFPLYCDAMPGCVKTFIEALADYRGRAEGKAVGYIVHSGFPEAIHSRAVERYLAKLTRRLGASYIGTIVRGHTEGIRDFPREKTEKLRRAFYELGRNLGESGTFDEGVVAALAGPETLPGPVRGLFKLLGWTGVVDIMWNRMLKANGAFARRFDRPYLESKQ